jgi:hypothetical protein
MQATLDQASAMLRASYTISAPTLQRFNAAVPAGERSRVMERYMLQALQEREQAREKEMGAIVDAYMTDPAFAQCRADEGLWDVTAADGLETL